MYLKIPEAWAVLFAQNRFRVQNHIKGVHACAMAILAESATGTVFGMNVDDSKLPLLKRCSAPLLSVHC